MTHSCVVDKNQWDELHTKLIEAGLKDIPSSSEYEEWRMKSFATAILYKSGKLVVQGQDISKFVEVVDRVLNENLSSSVSILNEIGADEVGKGDYFGPLVVSAVYVNSSQANIIKKIGAVDSKKLSDRDIGLIASKIKKIVQFKTQVITPEEYNKRYSEVKNISILLAEAHADNVLSLIRSIRKPIDRVVIDQFSSMKSRLNNAFGQRLGNVELVQFHRAESEVSVAAASVLARAEFITQMDIMSKKYAMNFPKGAAHVVGFARDFVQKYSADELKKVAKITFRTTKEVLS